MADKKEIDKNEIQIKLEKIIDRSNAQNKILKKILRTIQPDDDAQEK